MLHKDLKNYEEELEEQWEDEGAYGHLFHWPDIEPEFLEWDGHQVSSIELIWEGGTKWSFQATALGPYDQHGSVDYEKWGSLKAPFTPTSAEDMKRLLNTFYKGMDQNKIAWKIVKDRPWEM